MCVDPTSYKLSRYLPRGDFIDDDRPLRTHVLSRIVPHGKMTY